MSVSTNPSNGDVRLVCFDLGHVLIDVCRDWGHAAELAGVSLPAHPFDGATRAAITEAIHASEIGRIDQQTFCERVGEAAGLAPDAVHQISTCFLRTMYPGIEALLDTLDDRGIALACLSNTNQHHWSLMHDETSASRLPIHLLAYRWASHELGLSKPDAAIYHRCQSECGIDAAGILFFDNLSANVESARACGWRSELIAMDGDPAPQLRAHLQAYGVL